MAAYRRDTWFQESYEQTSRLVGDAAAFAHRHGLLLLKPDAVVARAVEPTLDWLVDNGFTVVAARRIHVDRNLVRALWYFQWNSASAERRHLADLLLRVSDSMVLVVADTGTELPASVRLTELKGPTDPGKRTEGQLRHLLGRYTYLLNMVHTPDDPADVIRELGIYFDARTRAEVLAETIAGEDRSGQAREIAGDLYEATPARSLSRSEAEDVLRAQLCGSEPDGDSAWAATLTDALDRGDPLDPWSVIVIGSAVLPMRTGGQAPTLGGVTPERWRGQQ